MVSYDHTVIVSACSGTITSPWFMLDDDKANTTIMTSRDKHKFLFNVQRTCQNPQMVTPTVYTQDSILNATVAGTALAPGIHEVICAGAAYQAIRYIIVSGNTSSDTTFKFIVHQSG